MRLIDADEMLVNESRAYISVQQEIDDLLTRQVNELVHLRTQKLIFAMPTIEVEPVRHGRWEEISSVKNIGECNIPISKCSCCGLSYCDILNNNELYNYCPNCGARMDVTEK